MNDILVDAHGENTNLRQNTNWLVKTPSTGSGWMVGENTNNRRSQYPEYS
jgi:hypothetical protein